jgi:hypothetical protein
MLHFSQAGQPDSYAFRFGPVEGHGVARTAAIQGVPTVRLGPHFRGTDRFEGAHQRFVVPAGTAMLAWIEQCTTAIHDAAAADASLRDVLSDLPPPAQRTRAIPRG